MLTPQKVKKWFLSSKKYDPGFSSRIPDPGDDFLPSRIQGSKRYPIPNPDPQHCILYLKNNENEPSQSHKHKKLSKIYFLSGILKVNDEKTINRIYGPDPNPDPEPLVIVKDPLIRKNPKISLIRNTDISQSSYCHALLTFLSWSSFSLQLLSHISLLRIRINLPIQWGNIADY